MKIIKKIIIISVFILSLLLTSCSSVDTVVGTTWHHDFVGVTVDFHEDNTITFYDIIKSAGNYNGEYIETTEVYVSYGTYTWNEDGTGEFYLPEDCIIGSMGTISIVDNELVMTNTDNVMYTFFEQSEVPDESLIVYEE